MFMSKKQTNETLALEFTNPPMDGYKCGHQDCKCTIMYVDGYYIGYDEEGSQTGNHPIVMSGTLKIEREGETVVFGDTTRKTMFCSRECVKDALWDSIENL
jgi:hypothetical protein